MQFLFPGITQISFDIRFDLLFMTLIRFYNQSVKRDIAKEKQTWLVLYLYRKKVTFPFSINAWYKDILHSFENMTNMSVIFSISDKVSILSKSPVENEILLI